MRGIKALVILAVAAFYFAVMTRSERADQLMTDPVFGKTGLKQGQVLF